MQVRATRGQGPAKLAVPGHRKSPLGAGEKGEFRGNPDKPAPFLCLITDQTRRGKIDTKWFFREQIFARAEYVEVEGLVQVMWHRHVNHVDVFAGEKRPMIGVKVPHGGDALKPIERVGADVANRHKLRLHRAVKHGNPATEGAGHLAAHQTGANDTYTNRNQMRGGHASRSLMKDLAKISVTSL